MLYTHPICSKCVFLALGCNLHTLEFTPFKVYNLMKSSNYVQLHNQHNQDTKWLPYFTRCPGTFLQLISLLSSSQPLIYFMLLQFGFFRYHLINSCGNSGFALSLSIMFEILSFVCAYPYAFSFHCWVVFHSMDIPYVVFNILTSWKTLVIFHVWATMNTTVNIYFRSLSLWSGFVFLVPFIEFFDIPVTIINAL